MNSTTKGILDGTVIPSSIGNDTRGKFIEEKFEEHGFDINKGPGVDIPDSNIEIKSRMIESSSPHSIGTYSKSYISTHSYDESYIKDKLQQWVRPLYSDTHNEIIRTENLDLTDPFIQNQLKEGYENCRKQLIELPDDSNQTYISSGCIVFEKKKTGWQVRIPDSQMKNITAISKQVFNNIFEVK